VSDSESASVIDSLRDLVSDSESALVRASVSTLVRASLRASVSASVSGAVRASLRVSLRDSVIDSVIASVQHYWWACNWGSMECWAASYFDTMIELLGLDLPKAAGIIEMAQSCGWFWPYENFVLMTPRPQVIKLDQEQRLHCEDGPAVAYEDGWGVYACHGVRVPGSHRGPCRHHSAADRGRTERGDPARHA
jgi:hypothetical protein